MGLIDLKTDLKSLKYGRDKAGGGSSGQPFVQKPLPTSLSQTGNTGGFDSLVRGGVILNVFYDVKFVLIDHVFERYYFCKRRVILIVVD